MATNFTLHHDTEVSFIDKSWACRTRRDAVSLLRSSRPNIRTRLTGPVGPELDWSFRWSRITNDEVGKRTGYPTIRVRDAVRGCTVPGPRAEFYEHQELGFVFTSDEGIRRWTEFCVREGVHYNGTHGYRFPGKKSRPKLLKETFVRLKEHGLIPCHKRSSEAVVRRGRRCRKAQTDSPLKRSWVAFQVKEPVVVRPSKSCRTIREEWRPLNPRPRFSEYRISAKALLEPVSYLSVGKIYCKLTPMLAKAIDRIYARSVLVPKRDISYNQVVGKPPSFKWRVQEPRSVPSSVPMLERQVGNAYRIIVNPNGESYKDFIGGKTSKLV